MRGSRHERLPRRHCGHSAPPVRSGDLQARPDASHEVPVPFSACRSRRAGRGCRVPADAAPWLQETVCSTWRFYALRAALGSVRHVTTVKCSPRVSAVLPHWPLLWRGQDKSCPYWRNDRRTRGSVISPASGSS
jgi:hypothetical protein